jgi:hypothetical protein
MAEDNAEKAVRVHGIKRVRIETAEQYAKRLAAQNARNAAKREARTAQGTAATKALVELAQTNTVESCREYLRTFAGPRTSELRGDGWLDAPKSYPGREHIDVSLLGRNWLKPMTAWLTNRRRRGYETEKDTRATLHLLCDYLFLYLPWWVELHPGAGVAVPSAPRDFKRVLYVARTDDATEQLNELSGPAPMTLLEVVKLRRLSPDTFNTAIAQIEKFFQYVATAYEDAPSIAGKNMPNPIRLYFDKLKSSARTKTNKVPFDEFVYPHLVHYTQAVEAFGEYLQQLAYEENALATGRQRAPYYDCEEWGYVPFVRFRGSIYPVRRVPSVIHLPKRKFHMNPSGTAGIYVGGRRINQGAPRIELRRIPHLGLLRMLMGLIETGLRGQGLQWLDRVKWDSLNANPRKIAELHTSQPDEMFTKMYVNTDKSKDAPWTTYISWRFRRSLLAEQYFQESIADAKIDVASPYEGREHSRFEPVVPMFRSNLKPAPYDDQTYSNYWKELLLGFQEYYNGRVEYSANAPKGKPVELGAPIELFVKIVSFEADGITPQVADGENGKYCPVSWTAVSSPHACRATYATLRDGDLEVDEIAEQIGHDSTVTTTYYQVASARRLRSKLEQAERAIMQYDAEGKSEAFPHPESPDSPVRKAFAAGRNDAIERFGFVNGVTFWSTEDLESDDETALDLLRESAASVIKWHPTHVCPVGNQCPSDIVPKIGGLQRCGLCPLAAKCVDHLAGIAAKKNELREKIRTAAHQIAKLKNRENTGELIDHLHRQMSIDAKELMGWELSEQILLSELARLEANQPKVYHAHAPQLVRAHLQRIVRDSSESAFVLQRIAESSAYPSLETPEIRARAAKYVRVILARAGRLEDAATLDIEPFDELQCFASLVKPMVEAKGLQLDDVASALTGQPSTARALASNPHPLLEAQTEET